MQKDRNKNEKSGLNIDLRCRRYGNAVKECLDQQTADAV